MFPLEVLRALEDGCGVSGNRPLSCGRADTLSELSAQHAAQQLRHRWETGVEATLDSRDTLWQLRYSLNTERFIRATGEAVITAAGECLPREILWFDCDAQQAKPISLQQFCARWHAGSMASRLELGRALAATFHPKKHADGSAVDYSKGADSYDQPAERVLPRCYGQWELAKAADNRPNCLGKFQLLVALGRLLGLEMLCLTALDYATTLTNQYRALAAREVYRTSVELGVFLNPKRQEGLLKIIRQQVINESLPPLQHFAVLYRVRSDCWMLVDPNSGLASYAGEPQAFERALQALEKLNAKAPGASLLCGDTAQESGLKERLQQVASAREVALQVVPLLKMARSYAELLQRVTISPIGDALLESDDALEIVRSDTLGRMDELLAKLWQKAHSDIRFERSSEQVPQLLETIVYRYLKAGESEMLSQHQLDVLLGKAFPPRYELSLVPFRLATATISHVAFALDTEVGFDTEELLYSFGIAEGHLYNVASGVRFSRASTHTDRAVRLLQLQSQHGTLARRFFTVKEKGYGQG